jgi:hypothetical protein
MTETNRIYLVLFGMQSRTFGPYLAANNRILISLMADWAAAREQATTGMRVLFRFAKWGPHFLFC